MLRAVSACAVKYAVKCALYSKYLCSEVWSQVCSEVYSQVCSIQSSVQLLGIACLCYAVMVLCCIYLLLLMSQLWTWKIIPIWCIILVCTALVTTLQCTYITQNLLIHMLARYPVMQWGWLPITSGNLPPSCFQHQRIPITSGNLPPLFTASKSCPLTGSLKIQYMEGWQFRAEHWIKSDLDISTALFPDYIFRNPIYGLFYMKWHF